MKKTGAAPNASVSPSRTPVRSSPASSKTSKMPTPQQNDNGRQPSQGVSNGASPVPSLSWTAGSLASDMNDGSMLDNQISSNFLMREATNDFGEDIQLGNADILALGNHNSPDMMWTDFSEPVEKQINNPHTAPNLGNAYFDAFSSFGQMTDSSSSTSNFASSRPNHSYPEQIFSLQSPSSSTSSMPLSTSQLAEAAKQIENLGVSQDRQQPDIRSSLGDSTPPASEPISIAAPNFFANVTAESSNPNSGALSQASCQCFTSALLLLENLTLGDTRPCTRNIAYRLHLKKRVLAQCSRLLDCRRCSGISSFMVLIIVLCEKMTSSYEQVLFFLTEQYAKSQQEYSQPSPSLFNNRIDDSFMHDDERQMRFRDYAVDPDEAPFIFGGLALTQLKKLGDFLARTKIMLKGWNWDLHLAKLEYVENRVLEQLRLYGKRGDDY